VKLCEGSRLGEKYAYRPMDYGGRDFKTGKFYACNGECCETEYDDPTCAKSD